MLRHSKSLIANLVVKDIEKWKTTFFSFQVEDIPGGIKAYSEFDMC